MNKTLYIRGAIISYSIWEVGDKYNSLSHFLKDLRKFNEVLFIDLGDEKSHNHIPMACKDLVAILYMFDLTNRCA